MCDGKVAKRYTWQNISNSLLNKCRHKSQKKLIVYECCKFRWTSSKVIFISKNEHLSINMLQYFAIP